VAVAIQIGEGLADARKKLFELGKAKFERNGIAIKIGRQIHFCVGDNDGAASRSKIFAEFAEPAADFVVFAVAGEILQKKNGVAVDDGNVGKGLTGIVSVIERFALVSRKSLGDAPSVNRNIEFGTDLEKELFDALFLSGLDGDNWVAGVYEKAKIVALIKSGRSRGHGLIPDVKNQFCGNPSRNRVIIPWFDFTCSVP